MASDDLLEIRPRTAGEILDDASRVYLADAPRLLLLHGLFHVPAFCVLLLLLARPTPATTLGKLLLPALAALLTPLTGISSGACQEFFRRRAEGSDPSLRECLSAALRRGPEHAAARCVMLLTAVPSLFCVLLPGLVVWMSGATLHAHLADSPRGLLQTLKGVGQEARFDPLKAGAVVLSRVPLLLMAVINLYALIAIAVWCANNLAGFDLALLARQLDVGNGIYVVALFLFAWLLLGPFFEAANYLLYLDTRTRQEGLDLLYRVQRAFGAVETRRAGFILLALGGLLFGAATLPAREADEPLAAVRAARQEVETIRQTIKDEDPYRSGAANERRLRELADRTERATNAGADGLRWFRDAIEHFKERNRRDALLVLDNVQRRLSLWEESLSGPRDGARRSREDIKKLVRPRADDPTTAPKAPPDKEPEHVELKRPEIRREGGKGGPSGAAGPSVSLPAVGGLGWVCWLVFAGLVLAVVVAAVVLFFVNRGPARAAPKAETGRGVVGPDRAPQELLEQPPAELLRRADALAREGNHLEALRTAYLAVLALLHRRQLLRYEPTRTNGEYVREVRLAPHAPAALHEPFDRLTRLFEVKWYGDRACDADEYRAGRETAAEMQTIVEDAR